MSKKTREIIERYIDESQIKNIKKFILSHYDGNGSFYALVPSSYDTVFALGILEKFGKKPHENTYKYVESLQTDNNGFAESPGHFPWCQNTYNGSIMFKYLGLKPRRGIEKFILSRQTVSGGFGEIGEPIANINSTIQWGLSLKNLGYKIRNFDNLVKYIKNKIRDKNTVLFPFHIYGIRKLINIDEKSESILNKYSNYWSEHSQNLQTAYYLDDYSLKLKLGDTCREILKNPERHSISDIFYAINLFPEFANEETIINYIMSLECEGGGFWDKTNRNLLTMYESLMVLDMLNEEIPDKRKMINWVYSCKTNDGGVAGSPRSNSWINMPFRALRILKILNAENSYIKNGLYKYVLGEIKKLSTFNIYYGSFALEELGRTIDNHKKLIDDTILKFRSRGGFSGVQKGHPEMYSTARMVIGALNLKKINGDISIFAKNEIKRAKKWILSTFSNGGFGWYPSGRPYIQPTYLALNSLYMMDGKVDTKNVIEFILSCLNDDGGFNGGEEKTASFSIYTFYGLSALLIMESMKNNTKIYDKYIGL